MHKVVIPILISLSNYSHNPTQTIHYYSHLRKVRNINNETILQNEIRLGVSDIAVTFRANNFATKMENRYMKSGLPKGFPDIFGYRKSDKQFFAIEIKTATGRPSKEQKEILKSFKEQGVLSGIARSVEDARRIICGQQ